MSSHLEIWKPSGRELITLSGQRVTVGQASTNLVSLKHDATVSRLHAVLENLGCAWSIRDVGSRNGTYLNGEKIAAERVLRSGDELRVGNSRLIFWEAKQADEASVYGTRRPGRDQASGRRARPVRGSSHGTVGGEAVRRRPESGQAIETLQLSLIAPSEIIQVDAKIAPALLDQVPIPRRIADEDAAFRR
jgi:pSer/pThr/pTyr-binding forkhead associated (FHA) protein